MNRISRYSLACGCAAVALIAAVPAFAQAAQEGGEDQELVQQPLPESNVIIVQALKQDASLLDTPATVSVVSQEELTVSNITSARDLGGIVPNFSFMQGVAGGSASFRGLGSNSADPAIENSVGGFNDGIYLGHSRDFTTPLYDIAQIEFVAGTQSTLLGKNTSLGAVSITSRRPGRDFAFDGSVTYTTEVDAVTVRAGLDVPLGTDFAVRFAGFYNDEQGYARNEFIGRDEQELRDASGRIVVDGDLSDNMRVTALYQHDRRRSDGQYFEILNDPDGLYAFFSTAVLGLPDAVVDTVPNDISFNGSDRLNPAAPAVPLPYDDQDSDRGTIIVEIDTASGGMITAQTGYLDWDSSRRIDQDYTPALILDLIDDETNTVLSQELRYASPTDRTFSFIAGLYYYHNEYSLRRQIQSDLGEDLDGFSDIRTDFFSAFGSGRYAFGDSLAVLGGLRYNLEDKTVFYDISGSLAIPIDRAILAPDADDEVDYNFGLEFTPNPDLLIYASYARGSKNGGFQSIPDSLALAQYGTEVAKSIELGLKYDLGAGAIELAAFDTRIDDFQTSRLVTAPGFPIPLTQIANVDARTTGAQATLRYELFDGFGISGSLAYTDARFTEGLENEVAPGVFVTEIFDGMRLVRAPEWTGRLAYDFRTALGGSLELSSNGVMRYQSDAFLQFQASQPAAPITEEHAMIDLEVRIGDPGTGWSIAGIVNNLTDVRPTLFTSDWLLAGFLNPAATPAYYGNRSRPRTFSIQAALEF